MENQIAYELMKLWVLWYSSAAFFGAFLGTMTALAVRSIIRRIKRR